jgi:hypothetical protein
MLFNSNFSGFYACLLFCFRGLTAQLNVTELYKKKVNANIATQLLHTITKEHETEQKGKQNRRNKEQTINGVYSCRPTF